VAFSGEGGPPPERALLDDLPVGIWVARAPGGELVYANRAFGEIMGMPARADVGAGEYAPGYNLQDREGRPYPEERLPFTQALRRRETVVVDDIVIVRPDGGRVFVRATGKPLFDAAGAIAQIAVAFIDISAEVKAQADGVVAQRKLKVALQHAPIILYAYDLDGIITVSEGAALKRMGLEAGQLVGQSVWDLYKENPGVLDSVRRGFAGESFSAVADLGEIVLESSFSPVRSSSGEMVGVTGISTDVTERTRMQQEVHRTERLAALGRLAASVAHEINNPLAYSMEALRLAGELVGRAGPAASEDRARLDELMREAREGMERVRHITRDLKLFSREEPEERRPHDIRCVLSGAAKMVATRAGARARLDIEAGPSATILADENRLVQIFVNLILNAADALPAVGVERNRITVHSRIEDGTVVVEVGDNGPGIPADLRGRVFEPFFTTKPVGEGTGLGLFVTRNLVEALGGSIALGESPEGGAVFTIRLPTVATPAAAEAVNVPASAPADAARAPTVPARARVLIIDDEAALARVFQTALASRHDVRLFTDGRAALAHLLEGASYDVILCDLMMGDISGMKVFEEVRRGRPGLERAFVFMTGGVFDPQVAEFLASVPNDCLDKPFDVRAEVARRVPSI
jgi:two-component system cell cycle sensor histidine kinase/response regulator CckA